MSGHKRCRVVKEYCRVQKMHLIRETGAQAISCRVIQVVRVDTSIVELYESFQWTQALSSRQRILSSGKMLLIRETGAQAISCRVVRVDTSVVELYQLYEWTQALSSRQRILSSGKMHLVETGRFACKSFRLQVDSPTLKSISRDT